VRPEGSGLASAGSQVLYESLVYYVGQLANPDLDFLVSRTHILHLPENVTRVDAAFFEVWPDDVI
jgi:hypothetical protein